MSGKYVKVDTYSAAIQTAIDGLDDCCVARYKWDGDDKVAAFVHVGPPSAIPTALTDEGFVEVTQAAIKTLVEDAAWAKDDI